MYGMSQLDGIAVARLTQLANKLSRLAIENLHILLENAEMEGRRDDLTSLMPLTTATDEQTLVEPTHEEAILQGFVQQLCTAQNLLDVTWIEHHYAEGLAQPDGIGVAILGRQIANNLANLLRLQTHEEIRITDQWQRLWARELLGQLLDTTQTLAQQAEPAKYRQCQHGANDAGDD